MHMVKDAPPVPRIIFEYNIFYKAITSETPDAMIAVDHLVMIARLLGFPFGLMAELLSDPIHKNELRRMCISWAIDSDNEAVQTALATVRELIDY